MARRPLLVGASTAAIEGLYYKEEWSESIKLGAVSAGSTIATNYVAPMVGVRGQGVETLIASAVYAAAAPRLVETAEEQTFTTRFFTSIASHIVAGVGQRVLMRGTVGALAHEVSQYSPQLAAATNDMQP